MEQTSKESEGKEKTETNTGGQGARGLVEMVCESGDMEDWGTVDSPVCLIREASAVESVVFGRVILGGGPVLFGDMLAVEILSVRRGEEPDSEN